MRARPPFAPVGEGDCRVQVVHLMKTTVKDHGRLDFLVRLRGFSIFVVRGTQRVAAPAG